ncbi:ferredoxin hydrogenase [Acididesulfobacillus acetoxydans]|uniref:Ferredoxin hydrogenase n=1 Tax=Acididesulfobacillus acetoxydans TaxID=1561005 RepID=A0A8S0WEJ3_9FIRM|nr:hydrogenase small subunit [Acididesulfobacillus acetoxydans]CAA7600182.1 ferredoxin hydrogenase [Acididesulfobacillus acetoxydans]CEJ09560.1 Hydrogenase-1 small chain [Acididesulfobacillus acetoxydans]
MDFQSRLERKGLNRREFLKAVAAATAALGLPAIYEPRIAEAVEKAAAKPPVIWLEGQDCTGCTESVLASFDPGPAEIVLDLLSVRYHETIMAASGTVAESWLEDNIKQGGYLLVVEGSIPTADDRFLTIGGRPFRQIVEEAAAKAGAIVAVGACACFGGIPAAGPTGAKGVQDVVKNKPVINLPGCPVKPTWVLGTVLQYLVFKKVPQLDGNKRPLAYFGTLLHDNCPRRGHFEQSQFLTDWNDPSQKDYCLLLKGCKGPKTYTDCAQSWWNDGVNFCINASSPCAGCTQPEFYAAGPLDHRAGFAPLYVRTDTMSLPGVGGVSPGTVGKVIAGAAVVGAGVHLIGNAATGRLKQEKQEKPGKPDKPEKGRRN